MAKGVNREHGHYRRPVGGSRTVVPSEATGRWTREAVAGHACGFERCILGVTHRRDLGTIFRLAIRLIKPVIDVSNPGRAAGCCPVIPFYKGESQGKVLPDDWKERINS